MATTTNYSWTTPDDTALVKDGAAAIRTLGSSVDTTVKALNPGTTAGDIDYYTSSTAKSRIGIGSSGQVLAVNGSGVPAWTTVSSGGMTSIAAASFSGVTTVSITSIPTTYKSLRLEISQFAPALTGGTTMNMQFNSDTATRYKRVTGHVAGTNQTFASSSLTIIPNSWNGSSTSWAVVELPNYASTTTWKGMSAWSWGKDNTTQTNITYDVNDGYYNQTTAITSIQLSNSTVENMSGSYILYGVS